MIACRTRYGSTIGPKATARAAKRTTVIAQAPTMSLRRLQRDLPSRSRRAASRLPGGGEAAGHGARQEFPEALAEARAGRVLRGGDADVVAAVVLDEEVPVAGLREGDAGEPLLHVVALVAELVGGVDADPADDAHGDRRGRCFRPRESPPSPHFQQAKISPAYWIGMKR